jgi:AcrR family transcriptional regulator
MNSGLSTDYRDGDMPDPTASPRPDAAETRRALLAAAHDLLASEGPAALSVRRIAAAAGVSTMNVYSRFGGKDGVVEELFVDGFARLGDAMSQDATTDDPLADLRRCGAGYRRFAKENPTYYSLMFDRAVPDFEPSDEAHAGALAALGHLAEKVSRAMELGALAPADPFEVAAGIWACEHGLVSLEMRKDADDPFDWDRIVPQTLDALLRGLGPVPPGQPPRE